jgi:NRAMP (natural resistance-associated macrophage protein)-like metal ion transporter
MQSRIQQLVSNIKKRIQLFFDALGPGFITGAADDDPSGIGTYSVAGAQLGPSILWTALLTWPLMAAVQMMCARIGLVTGRGLGASLKRKFPRPVLILFCSTLFVANTFNVGADLAAMADAAWMLTGIPRPIMIIVFGGAITYATIRLSYSLIARVLKWLALFLFSYVITAFVVGPNWWSVAKWTFIPTLPTNGLGWSTLVAILGTTISPYLFYWQASQEVEEKKAVGQTRVNDRIGCTKDELVARAFDVGVGTFFSNTVMFFIILTTGITLFEHGITNIQTSADAAQVLKPMAGNFAAFLYTIGLVGTGLLAIPTLTGSVAYAWAETFGWTQGLNASLHRARSFYFVIIASTIVGIGLDFTSLQPVEALYWSAVINGLLAPFLLLGILVVASDSKIMYGQPSPMIARITVGLTILLMFGCGVAMFLL